MYEQFKNQLLLSLEPFYGNEDLQLILGCLDRVAYDYDIAKKETSVAVYNEEIPEIAKIYLVSRKVEGTSEKTLYNYGMALKNFFRTIQKPIEQITANDIRVYLYQYKEQRNVSDVTLDRLRQTLDTFFKWACCEDYLVKNPMQTIKPIKCETKQRQALSQIDLEYLRQACVTLKEKAIVEFFYSTGCRVSELADVKKCDIDWITKEVHLFGKGKKHRTSYLNAKAEVALKKYLDSRTDDNEYVFVSDRKPHNQMHACGIQKIIRNLAERASDHVQKKVTPHIFRHTTATTAMNNGMPVESIRLLLGHENIATTMVYAKASMESVKMGHKKHVI